MIRGIALAALLIVVVLSSAPANAVPDTCSLSSTGIAFGAFSGSPLTSSGTITMNCTGSGNNRFNLRLSTGGSGTYSPRRMSNGANSLNYNLYQDAALTQIWGDGTGGTTFAAGTINFGPFSTFVMKFTVFASLPAQAIPAVGPYSDSVIATLTCIVGGNCTATTSIPITASVGSACTISATNLNFGTYTLAQLDGQSQIALTCANGAAWNVGLDAGASAGATVTTRSMTGPSPYKLGYSLFSDAARTINWGNTAGTDTVSGTGTGASQTLNVYGRIPAAQGAAPGSYLDTITVTISF